MKTNFSNKLLIMKTNFSNKLLRTVAYVTEKEVEKSNARCKIASEAKVNVIVIGRNVR